MGKNRHIFLYYIKIVFNYVKNIINFTNFSLQIWLKLFCFVSFLFFIFFLCGLRSHHLDNIMWGLGTLPEGLYLNQIYSIYRPTVCWSTALHSISHYIIEHFPVAKIHFISFLFILKIIYHAGFPAAYAAYAAGRGYSGYPSFGLPYQTGKQIHEHFPIFHFLKRWFVCVCVDLMLIPIILYGY